MLEFALEAAQAMVRVGLPGGSDSGLTVAADLVMANNCVIASPEEALRAEFTFNYPLDRHGMAEDPVTVATLADGLFHTHPTLDYTVLKLRDPPRFGPPLKQGGALVRRDDRVSIIQHPGGHFKKISTHNNFVAYVDRQVVQYTTSTLPGSSGSPVFGADFHDVAIHREGGGLQESGGNRHCLRNGGTSMAAVLVDLKENAPEIYGRLVR